MAIVGGAKISTKLDLLGNLIAKVDMLIIGGGMANTFLAAQGKAVGKSLAEKRPGRRPRARSSPRPRRSGARSCCRSMPWWRRSSRRTRPRASVDVDQVGADDMILDIGPRSVEHVVSALARAKTLVWNGPFGAFEIEPFDNGTVEVARSGRRTDRRPASLSRWPAAATRWLRSMPPASRTIHLCVDGGRRLPGMARRQDVAGRRGAARRDPALHVGNGSTRDNVPA